MATERATIRPRNIPIVVPEFLSSCQGFAAQGNAPIHIRCKSMVFLRGGRRRGALRTSSVLTAEDLSEKVRLRPRTRAQDIPIEVKLKCGINCRAQVDSPLHLHGLRRGVRNRNSM